MKLSAFFQKNWRILLLVCLVILGLTLEYLAVFDWRVVFDWAETYSSSLWLPIVLVVLQIFLFMFALPGSSVLWIVAPIYEPITATLILVSGSTLGGLAAYWFAHKTPSSWVNNLRSQRIFTHLKQRSDFLSLFILRVLPGFPHSLINYSAGILKLRLLPFILSALIGLTIKTYLYAEVIYKATSASSIPELSSMEIIGPLLLIVLLALLARFVLPRGN